MTESGIAEVDGHGQRRARAGGAPGPGDRRGAGGAGRAGHHRRRAPGGHPAQPHRDAPAARVAAGRAGRPRAPAGVARLARVPALRLLAPRAAEPRGARRGLRPGQRGRAHRRRRGDDRDARAKRPRSMGAIAFFGDKYGSSVRVVQAGPALARVLRRHPRRLAGADRPHHAAVGGLHRLEHAAALRGDRASCRCSGPSSAERLVQAAAELLRTEPDELLAAISRLAERQRDAEKELARLRQQSSEAEAKTLAEAAAADGGVVVARRDKVEPDALRNLAQADPAPRRGARRRARRVARRDEGGDRGRHRRDARRHASSCARSAPMVGGGGGGSAEVAHGGREGSLPGSRRRWPRRSGFCRRERRRGVRARPGPGGRARSRGAPYRRGLQRQPAQPGQPLGHDSAQRRRGA